MIKFLKSKFLQILFIIFLAVFSYIERNSLCNSYNNQINLHTASYINKENNEGKRYAKLFAEQSKNQFSNKLDGLIIIVFCGFGVIIIPQIKNNKKDNS